MSDKERWLPILGFEGIYDVSDRGRVRRIKAYKSTFVGRILKPNIHSTGYARVWLNKDDSAPDHLCHRLVARAFLGECPIGKQVNHIDGNKINNRVENLEYLIPSENQLHAFRTGLHKPVRGSDSNLSKLTEDDVIVIRSLLGKKSQKFIAKKFGVDRSNISHIARGKSWAWLKT